MKPGLAELDNVVIVPHIASATTWTREGMATLAAANVAAILQDYPVWESDDISAVPLRRRAEGRTEHRQRSRS
jgi:hydroxypyruvate reductase 1